MSKKLVPGMVLGLKGSLGAGKSVITRGIARGLAIEGPITSPTYTLISEYHNGKLPLYHMDLYRIHSEEEFELLGPQDLLYGSGVCIIEWYQMVIDMLPQDLLEIEITILEDGCRKIEINREL